MPPVHAARRLPLAVLSLVAIAVLAVACGESRKLDTSGAENKIPRQLHREYPKARVGDTKCEPGKVKLAAGVTFTCTSTLDGQPVQMSVVEDDSHGNVRFVLDKPVVYVPDMTKDLADKFGTKSQGSSSPATPPKVSCPGAPTRVLSVLGSFRCTLTVDGQATSYSVVVCDPKPQLLYVPTDQLKDPAAACKKGAGSSGSGGSAGPSTTTTPAGQLPGD